MKRMIRRSYYLGEYLLMQLISRDRPGPFLRWFLRLPLLYYRLYRLGLGSLLGNQILVLTTIGRKTGLERKTPLGYAYDPESDTYCVTAGWRARTDWYRNLQHTPWFHAQVGRRSVRDLAQPVAAETYAHVFRKIIEQNPLAARYWPRWTGEPYEGSEATILEIADLFPMLTLRPQR